MAIDWTKLLEAGVALYGMDQQRDAAKGAAQMAVNRPYSTYTPFGSVQYNNGAMTVQPNATPFGSLAESIGVAGLTNYAGTTQDPYEALPGTFKGAGSTLDSYLDSSGKQFGEIAGSMFGKLGSVSPDERLALLREQARPEENRLINRLQDRQFAQGRLGSTGGAMETQAVVKGLGEADLSRQLAAADYAQREREQLFNIGSQAATAQGSRAADRFNLAGALLSTADNRRNQAFGNALQSQGAFMNMFNPLLQFANTGVAAGGGSPTAAQITADASNNYYAGLGSVAQQLTPALTDALKGMVKRGP